MLTKFGSGATTTATRSRESLRRFSYRVGRLQEPSLSERGDDGSLSVACAAVAIVRSLAQVA
jgi:hypothetical protein